MEDESCSEVIIEMLKPDASVELTAYKDELKVLNIHLQQHLMKNLLHRKMNLLHRKVKLRHQRMNLLRQTFVHWTI